MIINQKLLYMIKTVNVQEFRYNKLLLPSLYIVNAWSFENLETLMRKIMFKTLSSFVDFLTFCSSFSPYSRVLLYPFYVVGLCPTVIFL